MRVFSLIYFVQGLLFLMSFYFGEGLVFFDEQSGVYKSVKSLQSSGSDDDISIWIQGVASLVISTTLLVKRGSLKWTLVIVSVGIFFQFVSLLLIEVGSVFSTIIVAKDIYLVGAVICQIVAFLLIAVKCLKTLKD